MSTLRSVFFLSCLGLSAAALLAGCDNEDGGLIAHRAVIAVSEEPEGSHCSAGGQKVEAGVDVDGDGEPDDDVTTAYICSGEPGEEGAAGEPGDPGEPGVRGAEGGQGEPGDPGATGDEGAKGDDGDQGAQGDDGAKGDPGDDGDKGDKGDEGDQGDTGDTGDDGDDGVSTLIEITPVLPGIYCAEGGHRVDAGLDLDGNGELDDGNVTTHYVCNGQDADAELEIVGLWQETGPFGGLREITEEEFLYGTDVVEFDNDDNYLITQAPPDDPYNPNKFGKTYWTRYQNGGFYYRTTEYALDTLEEARNSSIIPDPTNLDECGFGTWSQLIHVVEIAGRWHSNFGGTNEITPSTFTYGEEVLQVDNDLNYAVTRNPSDAPYFPNQYGRSHWTEPDADGVFYFCSIEYDLDTLEQARMLTQVPDDSDPENSGCSGFSWTRLEPVIEIEGEWENAAEEAVSIDSDLFSSDLERAVATYDNAENRAITQNPSDAPEDADLFEVVVWTEIDGDTFYYCVVDSGLASLEAAQESEATADDSDPEVGGCDENPWVRLDR